jgi:hypothetical protein
MRRISPSTAEAMVQVSPTDSAEAAVEEAGAAAATWPANRQHASKEVKAAERNENMKSPSLL